MMLNKTLVVVAATMLMCGVVKADVLLEDNFDSGPIDTDTWNILTHSGWSIAHHAESNRLRIADSGSLNQVGGLVSKQTFTLGTQPLIIRGDLSRADNTNGGDVMLALMQDDNGLTVGDLGMMIPRWNKIPRLRQWAGGDTNFQSSGNLWLDDAGVGSGTVRFELHIDADNYTLLTSDDPSDLDTMVERSSGAHGLTYDTFQLGVVVQRTSFTAASHFADNVSVVPEPASVALLGLGSGLVLLRRRRDR